tara:strand:+ start:342 stop:1328 length:987 start_codon:yes stop_codon:yes gene_type:complete
MANLFTNNVTFRNGQMVIEEDGLVQETITTSDTKQFFTTAVNEFFMQDDEDADTQWQDIFRVIPGRGHGELFPFRPKDAVTTVTGTSFLAAQDETSTGSHGIVFNEVGEAGEIKFSRVVSAEKYVKHIKYGTAIGYSNEWFSDGQMALVEMVTEDFRRAANDKLAAIHYGALVAAVDAGLSSSTAVGSTKSNSSEMLTALNTAVSTMRRAKRRPEVLLIAPENEQLVRLALTMTVGGGSPEVVQNATTRRLNIIVTEYIAANTAYVIEPKRRLISTNRLPLSLGNFTDLVHDSEVLVGKFRRGVLVGEAAAIHGLTAVPQNIESTNDY